MWQGQVITGITGLCGGAVVATALAAFVIGLGIIPGCPRELPIQQIIFYCMKTA